MMMDVELQTEDGHFVAVVEILPFQVLPAVVMWGTRVFTLHTAGTLPADAALPVYREAFAFFSRTPSPGKPRALSPVCRNCAQPLLPDNVVLADGCPCNSGRGINHGLVSAETCTCKECDPAQTGGSRARTPTQELAYRARMAELEGT